MAFVTCSQFKQSQAEQDEQIKVLQACCDANTQTNTHQDEAIKGLQKKDQELSKVVLSAEDELVDKTSDTGDNGQGAGKLTTNKIKQAIAGDVEVAVNHQKGLSGNGKKSDPLAVKAKEGDFAFNAETGALELGSNALRVNKLGAGFKQDPVSGAFVVDAKEALGVKTNPDGSVGLSLSKDKGNLLELRKDGVYYGVTPPVDTSNLYVSSSQGNDGAKGTRNDPLRTINEAFKRNRPNQHFTIHLLETDVHEWRSSWGKKDRYTYTVMPYGAATDRVLADNPVNTINWARSKELKRPTIEFVFDKASYGELWTLVQSQFTDDPVIFNGIRFRKRQQEESTSIPYGVFGGATENVDIIFRGCEFDLSGPSHYLHIGKPMSPVVFDHSKLAGDGTLGQIEGNGSLAIGFRSMWSGASEGNLIQGLTTSGVASSLTYNGYSNEQTIISKFKGNTTVMRAGIIY